YRLTLVKINGKWMIIEKIWQKYHTKLWFDTDGGIWSQPSEKLIVDAYDEKTGKIIQAEIKHLYRQKVNEFLRKITLENKKEISITKAHHLFTRNGWSNQFDTNTEILCYLD